METRFIEKKHAESEEKRKYEISYFILSENRTYDGGQNMESFGVKIEMQEENKPENEKTSAYVSDITVNQNNINNIVNLLSKNLVTPISLSDVIDDCI